MKTTNVLPEKHSRNLSIDFLRGVSILAVMYYHYRPFGLGSWGLYGVSLFFMISGYCMVPSMSTSATCRHFLAKRMARLVPALVVAALITTFVKHHFLSDNWPGFGWGNYLKAMLCMPLADIPCSLLGIQYYAPDGVYWTLFVEIRFYVVVGVLFFLVGLNWLLASFATIASLLWLLILLWIYLVQHHVDVPFFGILAPYLAYFLAGLGAYYFLELGKRKTASLYILISVAILVAQHEVGYSDISFPIHYKSIIAFVVCAGLLIAAQRYINTASVRNFIAVKWVAGIGLISYPLYLLHQDVGVILIIWFAQSGVNEAAVRLAIVPVVMGMSAWLIHKSVEFRFAGALRKFFYRLLGIGFAPLEMIYRSLRLHHRTPGN